MSCPAACTSVWTTAPSAGSGRAMPLCCRRVTTRGPSGTRPTSTSISPAWPTTPGRGNPAQPRTSAGSRGPGAMPGPLHYARPVPTGALAAFIADLRGRLQRGELADLPPIDLGHEVTLSHVELAVRRMPVRCRDVQGDGPGRARAAALPCAVSVPGGQPAAD